MHYPAPVAKVLRVERRVEAVGVAENGNVGRRGSFAEHLDDGIARYEMDQKEDDRDHDPEDGEGDEDTADGFRQGEVQDSRFRVRGGCEVLDLMRKAISL